MILQRILKDPDGSFSLHEKHVLTMPTHLKGIESQILVRHNPREIYECFFPLHLKGKLFIVKER